MTKYLSIKDAADFLGVSTTTMRRWDQAKQLIPDERTQGNQRRYSLTQLEALSHTYSPTKKVTYCYARVSSHDQKPDLVRQQELLELFCASKGWTFEIIFDLGSGLNYHKRGLKKLLNEIIQGRVQRLVVTHKDRLLRFGAELIFAICEAKGIEVVVINQKGSITFEEELAQDVLEIITVFSAKLYGSRKKKNKQLAISLKAAVESNRG